ncbi:hypothetical protein [Hymenobacter sp. APR13]|uniref:hypothetical protein n=1 Tax=Hymenobacter sp. APR13 TaxID=1356852 RepID=UPI0012E09296|nr:hypothetical protein [Hymenobacter sp. APR13]
MMPTSELKHAVALRGRGPVLAPAPQVRWQLTPEGWFEATFDVPLPPGAAWNVNPSYSRTRYRDNWGLWEHDVVELFLQARPYPDVTSGPYLELQLSPLGQPFALVVEEPVRRYAAPETLAFLHENVPGEASWRVRVAVQVPGYAPGAPLFGNLTACLGPAEARTYWGLQLNAGPEPDFHRPTDFRQLI